MLTHAVTLRAPSPLPRQLRPQQPVLLTPRRCAATAPPPHQRQATAMLQARPLAAMPAARSARIGAAEHFCVAPRNLTNS
jgi:hypothetical protein